MRMQHNIYRLIIIVVVSIVLTACGQSQSAVQTSVVMTLTAMPTNTPIPSNTPVPTATATPLPTNTPTRTPTNTPKATATRRPPTPTEAPEVGSYERPVPMNLPYPFTYSGNQDFSLTVTEVKRGQDAWDMLYIANMFNDKAPDRMEWVCAYLKLNYTDGPSGTTIDINKYWFSTVSNGSILDIPFYVPPDPEFDVSVLPGGKAEGWICGHLFTDDANPVLLFAHSDTKPGWYFSLQQ
jgi:hypothetical protein